MGMPVTVEIVDGSARPASIDRVYEYFEYIDATFSTYKDNSEISRINRHELTPAQSSPDMQAIFALADQTRRETDGHFDIRRDGRYDPSGIVKGWAIQNAAGLLEAEGYENYYVEAGGDLQAMGHNSQGRNWRVGIQNPFNSAEIIKVLSVSNRGVATSGTYVRGEHIYNPKKHGQPVNEIVSLTVVGPNIYDADRFATAAFAMGLPGIHFIEGLEGFDGYMIDRAGLATYTSNFQRHVTHD
jgi:thiamine biosynthesis lipoprotein